VDLLFGYPTNATAPVRWISSPVVVDLSFAGGGKVTPPRRQIAEPWREVGRCDAEAASLRWT
jgi:hypothetical protein